MTPSQKYPNIYDVCAQITIAVYPNSNLKEVRHKFDEWLSNHEWTKIPLRLELIDQWVECLHYSEWREFSIGNDIIKANAPAGTHTLFNDYFFEVC